MIHYQDDDFESVDNPSARRIRFILSSWPEDNLHQIRLFRPAKSEELEKVTLSVFRKLYPYFFYNAEKIPESAQDFDELKEVKDTVRSIERTKEWLSSLAIPAQIEMVVSYDSQIAVLVQWSLFAASYEKCCYSGLDDICVFSTCERWYLLYYHEDIFLFGNRKERIE